MKGHPCGTVETHEICIVMAAYSIAGYCRESIIIISCFNPGADSSAWHSGNIVPISDVIGNLVVTWQMKGY